MGRTVCYHGIRLGTSVDLLVDARTLRALGLDVRCGDDCRRFLPLTACELADRRIEVASALVFMEDRFYREHARSLLALRGLPVARYGRHAGTLADLVVAEDGEARAVVVETPTGASELPLDDDLLLAVEPLQPAV